MSEIFALETTKRFRDTGKEARLSRSVRELAMTLTPTQKALLCNVINEAEEEGTMDPVKLCLLNPSCFTADLREANFVIDRYRDGKLYSRH